MKNSKKNFFSIKNILILKTFLYLKMTLNMFLNYLNKGKKKLINKKIIDIGCGNGSFLYF